MNIFRKINFVQIASGSMGWFLGLMVLTWQEQLGRI
jgi:hypothetical protein